jgi:hypothetical protein
VRKSHQSRRFNVHRQAAAAHERIASHLFPHVQNMHKRSPQKQPFHMASYYGTNTQEAREQHAKLEQLRIQQAERQEKLRTCAELERRFTSISNTLTTIEILLRR